MVSENNVGPMNKVILVSGADLGGRTKMGIYRTISYDAVP